MNDRRKKVVPSRKGRNTFVTKSGQTIKIHRNLGEHFMASRDARSRRKAARLAGMPKSPIKRALYRMHPKRMYHYWFSREGAIMALKITGVGIIAVFLLLVGVFAYFRKDLPDIKSISGDTLGGSIRYYDRTGKVLLWEDYDAVKRIPVDEKEISQYLRDATVAVEDKDFFKHGGFDVRGIMRAGINDVFGKGSKQGGSTITQQLVKLNNDWTKDRTYTRKIKELILAVELERSYSKQEILNGYVNEAPYGNVQYGAEAASRDYFQKSAKDLTIDEAAFLASMPKGPSEFSPYGSSFKEDPKYWSAKLKDRQHYIIGLMLNQHMITQKQYDEAIKVDTLAKAKQPQAKYEGIKAPYFVLTAKEELEAKYGASTIQRTGWKVTTTLDLGLQELAEQQVQKGLVQVKRQNGDEIAFAAEDVKTGQMVALVGNVVFDANQPKGQVNFARQKLAPGSSIKPYSYAALIENTTNFGAGSVLYDTQSPILPDYPCTNKEQPRSDGKGNGNCLWDYDRRFPGPLTLRYALGASRNVPAVKAMLTVGVPKVQETYKKLSGSPTGTKTGGSQDRGVYKCYSDLRKTVEIPCGGASGIGDGAYLKLDEHIHGYASLSRNGLNLPQTYILKIEDSENNITDEWKATPGVQEIRPDSAYIVDDMLADPNASYFTKKPHRYKGWKFSLKTGTTNDLKDGWLLGFSTRYAAGVWVGNGDGSELSGAMENMTQPIWQGWMNAVHDPLKPEDRVKPAGIQTLPAFIIRSHVEFGTVEPSPAMELYPSWYKPPTKSTGSKKTVDMVSNKLATDCTPARAKKEITDTDASGFSGDKFVNGSGANTNEQDDVHKCDDAKPTIQILTAPVTCNGSCSISVQVSAGSHSLSSGQFPGTINLIIDGQVVQSFSVDNGESGVPKNLTFNYSGSGSKSVTAQIVDSVLYDSNDETTINFSGASSINLTSASRGAIPNQNKVTFNWSGGSGTYTVYIDNIAAVGCINKPSGSCTATGVSLGAHSAKVKDSDGDESNTLAF